MLEQSSPSRVGFIVSKAVGNAVARNRVKRRLRVLVGKHWSAVPAHSLVVVRAKPGCAAATFSQLNEQLQRCLAQLSRKIDSPARLTAEQRHGQTG